MDLRKQIAKLIKESGLENKEVVALLDDIRKGYHNRKNVGVKGISEKELSKMIAIINGKDYPLSKDKGYIFYQGGWRKVYGDINSKHIVYLKTNLPVKFKKQSDAY